MSGPDTPSDDGVAPKGKSDLGVRAASAVAMILVAGVAVVAGGVVFRLFVAAVAIVLAWEMAHLVLRAFTELSVRILALGLGVIYIAAGTAAIAAMPRMLFVMLLVIVIACDTGAYFTGRRVGGPKIAPRISPSKTWSGLFGGMVGAGIAAAAMLGIFASMAGSRAAVAMQAGGVTMFVLIVVFGMLMAILAQCGDFFESWLKRRAGAKDSSNLIPGHGGVFDRVDGLLPVAIAGYALFMAVLALRAG